MKNSQKNFCWVFSKIISIFDIFSFFKFSVFNLQKTQNPNSYGNKRALSTGVLIQKKNTVVLSPLDDIFRPLSVLDPSPEIWAVRNEQKKNATDLRSKCFFEIKRDEIVLRIFFTKVKKFINIPLIFNFSLKVSSSLCPPQRNVTLNS